MAVNNRTGAQTYMKMLQVQRLVSVLDHLCDKHGWQVRAVLLAHKTAHYNNPKQRWESSRPTFPESVTERAKNADGVPVEFAFARGELEELQREERAPMLPGVEVA